MRADKARFCTDACDAAFFDLGALPDQPLRELIGELTERELAAAVAGRAAEGRRTGSRRAGRVLEHRPPRRRSA